MANAYLTLGQTLSTASTLVTLYTVPAATSAVCSSLVICNQGATTNYRIAVRKAGAAIEAKQYLVYDQYINANDTITLTLGLSLATTDVVSVYAGTSTVSFNLFGTEIS